MSFGVGALSDYEDYLQTILVTLKLESKIYGIRWLGGIPRLPELTDFATAFNSLKLQPNELQSIENSARQIRCC
jgi:hypothetical protein